HELTARLRMARRRYAAAIPHAERALDLEPTGEARADRWAALVTCLLNAGRHDAVADAVQMALAEGVPPAIRARLLADDAARLSAIGRMDEALRGFEIAEQEAKRADAPFALAVAAEGIALIKSFKNEFDEAVESAARAKEAYALAGNAHGQLRLMVLLAGIERARGDLQESLRLNKEALELARRRADRMAAEAALERLGLVQSQSGQWRQAMDTYREMFRLSVEDGRGFAASIALGNLAYMAGLIGDTGTALRLSRKALGLIKKHAARVECFAKRTRAQALRVAGKPRLAVRAARLALRMSAGVSVDEGDSSRLEI